MMSHLSIKETAPIRWEIVEGKYGEIISDMSLKEFRSLPDDDPRKAGKHEEVAPGEITISGLDIPITSHTPMGMLFNAVKESIQQEYGVSYCMVMLNRREKSTSPFRIQILVNTSPISERKAKINRWYATQEEAGKKIDADEIKACHERAKRRYNEACVKHYADLIALFKQALTAFAVDECGLRWYRKYVTTTDDPFPVQDDRIKEMRDHVLVKAQVMSQDRASDKRVDRARKTRKREKRERKAQAKMASGIAAILS